MESLRIRAWIYRALISYNTSKEAGNYRKPLLQHYTREHASSQNGVQAFLRHPLLAEIQGQFT